MISPLPRSPAQVNRASSVRRALQHFTAPEVLDGSNKYRCPKNNKMVSGQGKGGAQKPEAGTCER